MRFLLHVDAPGIETDFGKYAIVDLTDAYIQLLVRRRAFWKKIRSQDTDLTDMLFTDTSATYYNGIPKKLFSKTDRTTLNKYGVLRVQDNFGLSLDDEQAPTDFEKVIVGDADVCWFAGLKHLDFYVYTRGLKYEMFLPKEAA